MKGMQGDRAPLVFWVPLLAVALWRCDVEHLPVKRGFNAPALAALAAAQERTVLSWEFDAANGGPIHVLDTLALSKACGRACTPDGRHYRGAVEQVQIQIMANIYARSERQRPRDQAACSRPHDTADAAQPRVLLCMCAAATEQALEL
jgi:hypothetical protein